MRNCERKAAVKAFFIETCKFEKTKCPVKLVLVDENEHQFSEHCHKDNPS